MHSKPTIEVKIAHYTSEILVHAQSVREEQVADNAVTVVAHQGPKAEVIATETRLMEDVFPLLLLTHLRKGPQYGNSWCRRGLRGIFLTIARKWDRLEELFAENKQGMPVSPDLFEAPGESLEETVMDLAVYAVKWLGYIKATRPDRYEELVRNCVIKFNNLNERNHYFELGLRTHPTTDGADEATEA